MTSNNSTEQRPWLDEHLARWVDAGIVTTEQARDILGLERAAAAPQPVARRLPIGAEALAYAGSALALMGGVFVVARSWESLPVLARIAVGLLVAVLGLAGGRVMHTMDEPGTERLAGFLWVVGAAGAALTAGVTAVEAGVDEPELVALAVGATTLAIGALLWRNLDRPLQMLTTVAGAVTVASALGGHFELRTWLGGIIVLLAGLVVGALAVAGRLRPQLFVMLVAAVGLLIGSAMLSDLSEHLVAVVGLVTAGTIVITGLGTHRTPVLVVGVIGLLVFLQALFAMYFAGPVASSLVALVGLVVVAVVLVRTTRRRAEPEGPGR